MNKLKLNNTIRTHIKFIPLVNTWSGDMENTWNQLSERTDIKRLYYYRNVKRGLMLVVYEMDGFQYGITCMRNEYNTQNCQVYINECNDDLISCFKMLSNNLYEIGNQYGNEITKIIKNNSKISDSGNNQN